MIRGEGVVQEEPRMFHSDNELTNAMHDVFHYSDQFVMFPYTSETDLQEEIETASELIEDIQGLGLIISGIDTGKKYKQNVVTTGHFQDEEPSLSNYRIRVAYHFSDNPSRIRLVINECLQRRGGFKLNTEHLHKEGIEVQGILGPSYEDIQLGMEKARNSLGIRETLGSHMLRIANAVDDFLYIPPSY